VSGCLGLDAKTGQFVDGGVEEQALQALKNLKGVVESAGSELGKVVKTTVRVPSPHFLLPHGGYLARSTCALC